MRKLFALFCLLLGTVSSLPQTPKSLAFTHVTVIDCTGAKPKPDMTVVITNGKITAIGKSATIPADAQVIEATGKFLIPGLWDMHVHATEIPVFLSLYLANGVTGVRDMYAPNDSIFALRKQIQEGKTLGPRLVAAGRIVDGGLFWPRSEVVKNAEEGRKAVTTVKSEGSDFVKVYSGLSREAYFAIAAESKKQGIVFAGHVPEAISAGEASDAGQKSIEHLYGILRACSTEEEALKKISPFSKEASRKRIETFNEQKAEVLFAKLKRNKTWQCPTLVVLRPIAKRDDPEVTEEVRRISDVRMKYMPSFIPGSWNPKSDFSAEDFAQARREFRKDLELVGKMRKAGVEFLAGTDVMNPYSFPGFSLHDELALLVMAGLTPMEALQTATRNPARYFGEEMKRGTLQTGKAADLVLLDADPLQDIRNTTKIQAVVVNGKLLTRADLDKILAEAEAAANTK